MVNTRFLQLDERESRVQKPKSNPGEREHFWTTCGRSVAACLGCVGVVRHYGERNCFLHHEQREAALEEGKRKRKPSRGSLVRSPFRSVLSPPTHPTRTSLCSLVLHGLTLALDSPHFSSSSASFSAPSSAVACAFAERFRVPDGGRWHLEAPQTNKRTSTSHSISACP